MEWLVLIAVVVGAGAALQRRAAWREQAAAEREEARLHGARARPFAYPANERPFEVSAEELERAEAAMADVADIRAARAPSRGVKPPW